ncbi:hypothetical protein FF38_00467 [Lucilia cuprina]|uniref:Uncharacterized protein n=1 Tax=Lucilia cuprina TaxID=7375 RepID=A0A0L0BTD0_LUCCU|nr:hypothetical protein CVS40_11940 [Lucilia cuprina]KNC23335.1 hypothetical protein FF38_00467 [Lucilia cuprina]
MGLILGDNLGLNVTLNFAKSFSANHLCRFCLIKKEKINFLRQELQTIRFLMVYLHSMRPKIMQLILCMIYTKGYAIIFFANR